MSYRDNDNVGSHLIVHDGSGSLIDVILNSPTPTAVVTTTYVQIYPFPPVFIPRF